MERGELGSGDGAGRRPSVSAAVTGLDKRAAVTPFLSSPTSRPSVCLTFKA